MLNFTIYEKTDKITWTFFHFSIAHFSTKEILQIDVSQNLLTLKINSKKILTLLNR